MYLPGEIKINEVWRDRGNPCQLFHDTRGDRLQIVRTGQLRKLWDMPAIVTINSSLSILLQETRILTIPEVIELLDSDS